jgi:hypothetical protein
VVIRLTFRPGQDNDNDDTEGGERQQRRTWILNISTKCTIPLVPQWALAKDNHGVDKGEREEYVSVLISRETHSHKKWAWCSHCWWAKGGQGDDSCLRGARTVCTIVGNGRRDFGGVVRPGLCHGDGTR